VAIVSFVTRVTFHFLSSAIPRMISFPRVVLAPLDAVEGDLAKITGICVCL